MPNSFFGGLFNAARKSTVRAIARTYVALTDPRGDTDTRDIEVIQPTPVKESAPTSGPSRRRRPVAQPQTKDARPSQQRAESAREAPGGERRRRTRPALESAGPSTPSPATDGGQPEGQRRRAARELRVDTPANVKRASPAKRSATRLPKDAAEEYTAAPVFADAIVLALSEVDGSVTYVDLISRLSDTMTLKPGDRKTFTNGRERWKFMVTRELSTLRKAGKAVKDGDRWRLIR